MDPKIKEELLATADQLGDTLTDDLIMRGVAGEEYPIGRELFQRTYRLGTHPPRREWEQAEPVAYRYWKDKFACWEYSDVPLEFPAVPAGVEMEPLYTTPPRREWRGLTDEEIDAVWRKACADETLRTTADLVRAFARAVELALKERNA